jgi:hypothetical protein
MVRWMGFGLSSYDNRSDFMNRRLAVNNPPHSAFKESSLDVPKL